MMLKGLFKLSWIETKVFMREPLGLVGALLVPIFIYVLFSRVLGEPDSTALTVDAPFNVAVFATILIALGAVQSLIAIIAIYREGGILKRLRATPLSPVTILGAHVFVKLGFTLVSLVLLVLAGRQMFPGAMQVNLLAFAAAMLVSTLSILSLGFVIASVVPTARFAQPLGAVILYPMLAVSGLFVPLTLFPRWMQLISNVLPTTHAVSLLHGVWDGASIGSLAPNLLALAAFFVVSVAIATRVFRWE